MVLSKCQIDPKQLINPYQIHRLLWNYFPDHQQQKRPFLFQLERLGKGSVQHGEVLMLSTCQPQAVEPGEGVTLVATKPYAPRFETGQMLRFRLDANPVKRLNHSQNRVPLIREEEQIAWLRRKLGASASLGESVISAKEDLFFKKRGRAGKIAKVRYEGVLHVEHAEGVNQILKNGVGPAKAFGCGLLLLQRV